MHWTCKGIVRTEWLGNNFTSEVNMIFGRGAKNILFRSKPLHFRIFRLKEGTQNPPPFPYPPHGYEPDLYFINCLQTGRRWTYKCEYLKERLHSLYFSSSFDPYQFVKVLSRASGSSKTHDIMYFCRCFGASEQKKIYIFRKTVLQPTRPSFESSSDTSKPRETLDFEHYEW